MGHEHASYYGEIDWNGQTDLFFLLWIKKNACFPFYYIFKQDEWYSVTYIIRTNHKVQ